MAFADLRMVLNVYSCLTSVISGRNCEVIIGPRACCYRHPKKAGAYIIQIPISSNFTDLDIVLSNGFTVHEAAHAEWTDFSIPIYRLLNICEDIRIEKLAGEKYAGSKLDLCILVTALCENEDFFSHPAEHYTNRQLVESIALYQGRYLVLEQTALESRLKAGRQCLVKRHGVEKMRELDGVLSGLFHMRSTQDADSLSVEINAFIASLGDEGQPQQNNDDQGSNVPKGSSGDKSDGNEGDKGDESNASGDKDTDNNSESESSKDGSDSDDDGDESDGADGVPKDGKTSDGKGNKKPTSSKNNGEPKLGKIQESGDISKAIADKLNSKKNNATSANDLFSNLIIPSRSQGNTLVPKPEMAVVAGCKASFNRYVMGNTENNITHRKKGVVISGRRLAGVMAGDVRVFEHRTTKRQPTAAVSLLLDGSSSMANIFSQAAQACFSILKAMPKEFKAEVLTFSNHVYVEKTFNEPLPVIESKVINFESENTRLGAAIQSAIPRLLLQNREHRIIIAITDGESSDNCRQAIELAKKHGVKVMAIGIRHGVTPDGLSDDDFLVINTIDELPKALSSLLQRIH